MRLLVILAVLALATPASAQGAGQTVAILDTGIDADHPEFSGRVTRMSYVTIGPLPGGLDPGQLEDDPDGHGTATASIAAGATLGIAPDADILDLQVDNRYAPGIDTNAESAAIQALDDLLQDPYVEVVILSFAAAGVSDEGAQTLIAQANELRKAGVAVVVPRASTTSDLHRSPQVFTVGANKECSSVAPGMKPDIVVDADSLTVAAPGSAAQPAPQATRSGPHLAAAIAAGTMMRMFDVNPQLPVDAAYAILRDTATDIDIAGSDNCTGFGLLNAERAVKAADAWFDPVAPPPGTQDTPLPLMVALIALVGVALRKRHD